MSFQGLLQAEVGKKQAMTGMISVHQVARNGHVFFGAAAPKGNLFIDINRQSASVPQFSLTYSFGILSIIQFHWRMSRFDLIHPIEKRGCTMKVSQGIEQFFNYQRLNVKKNTFKNYEFILEAFQYHFGDIQLSSISSDSILAFMTEVSGEAKQSTKKLRFTLLAAFFSQRPPAQPEACNM